MTCLTCKHFKYSAWKSTINKRDNMPFMINDGCSLNNLEDKKIVVTENLKEQLSIIAMICPNYQEL